MKKILVIFIIFLFSSSHVKAGFIGSGELKLGPTAVKTFIEYIQMSDKPRLFLIPIDGSSAYTWRCPKGVQCVAGGYTQEIKKCEQYFKKDCAVFARFRTIKWNNGINKGKNESKFSSKMTDTEIKAKLKELGFLGSEKQKIEKKEGSQTQDAGDITKQLTNLIEMYESGTITEEEFKKAKKKLLD